MVIIVIHVIIISYVLTENTFILSLDKFFFDSTNGYSSISPSLISSYAYKNTYIKNYDYKFERELKTYPYKNTTSTGDIIEMQLKQETTSSVIDNLTINSTWFTTSNNVTGPRYTSNEYLMTSNYMFVNSFASSSINPLDFFQSPSNSNYDYTEYFNLGSCSYFNEGYQYDKQNFSLGVKSIVNYGQVSFVIKDNSKGIYVLLMQQQKLIYLTIETYIGKINDNLPDSPSLGFNSQLFNFNNLLISKSSGNDYEDCLIAQTDNFFVSWNITISNEKQSIVYIKYYTQVSSSNYYEAEYFNQVEIFNNYLIICTLDKGLFILERDRLIQGWYLIRTLNERCVDIKVGVNTLFIAIDARGLFLYDMIKLKLFYPFSDIDQNTPVIYHTSIIQLDLLTNTNSIRTTRILGLFLNNSEKEYLIELNIENERNPSIYRIYTSSYNIYSSNIVTYNQPSVGLISYFYDAFSQSVIVIPRFAPYYGNLISHKLYLGNVDISFNGYISLIIDENYGVNLLLNTDSSLYSLTGLHIKNSILKCEFEYSGVYEFAYSINKDCSVYDYNMNSIVNKYCSDIVKFQITVTISNSLIALWISLSCLGGIILCCTCFIIIYKYNCFIPRIDRKVDILKTKMPLYNDPRMLGIDINDIKIENNMNTNNNWNEFIYYGNNENNENRQAEVNTQQEKQERKEITPPKVEIIPNVNIDQQEESNLSVKPFKIQNEINNQNGIINNNINMKEGDSIRTNKLN